MTLSDTGVVSGINNYKASFKDLSAAANQAKKDLSDALAQMGSAAEAGNLQAQKILQGYRDEVARTESALQSYRSTAAEAAAQTEELTQAVSHQVPMMAAASGAVRELNGNLSVRAAERFLATTLQLGPALQAAFPVIGAIAMISVVDTLAEKLSQLVADTFIFTDAMKKAFQLQVDTNNQLVASQAHLSQAAAELFTTTHSASQNIQRDIDQEKAKRLELENQIKAQTVAADQLTRVTRDYVTFSNTATHGGGGIFNQFDSLDSAQKAAAAAQARVQALKIEAQAIDDTIQTSEAKLNDVQEKAAEDARKRAEQNANAWAAAWNKATNEAVQAWNKYNSELTEMDRLFNSFENDRMKETEKENKDSLDRRARDAEKELKDEQKQWNDQERAYKQYTQKLGDDLYQTFNDVTSGRIGTLIKQGVERLFANILAQWIATVNGINKINLHGGASGLIGSLLGSVFGTGGSGSAGAGGGSGPYGLPPGVAMNFDGGQFDNTDSFPAGAGISLGGGSLGSGSLSTAAIGSVLGSIGGGPPAQTPVGGAGTVPKSGGILSNILSPKSLSQLAPLALLGALTLGAKGGNSAIAAGALIGAGGLAALYGPNAALTGAAAPFAPFLGPLAGGLIGFGVGTAHGPVAGSLAGAGSGALVGLLAAGPIGALIGGIIGGLTGLFSGLFGGSPSKHSQADKYINANILPLISQEVTNYEGFRTDFATSINDLEAMRQNSYATLKQQFGTDATNDEWGRLVVPAINTAEDRIRSDETERQRRGTLLFGPPQFAVGGIFTAPNPGGAGVAILHDQERVMTSTATRMYGSQLAQMESNARAGVVASGSTGGDIHIHIHTLDTKTMPTWLRNGGAAMIQNAIRRRGLEGH